VSALLLINPRSGDEQPSAEDLLRAASERGIATRLLSPEDDLYEVARASGAEVLGAAGGDGTLAPVARAALELKIPFVCIPFGTRNHFARDLGLDLDDPLGSLDAFDGHERGVDIGRIGDRLFLNNVSLGLYATLVHRREHHRRRREAWAGARALWLSLRDRHPAPFTVDGEAIEARVLLVANNAYSPDLLSVGERERIDTGRLHLYALRGWLPGSWEDRSCERLLVDSAARPIRAAIDGEPEQLDPPLEFSIEPKALRVLVPRNGG